MELKKSGYFVDDVLLVESSLWGNGGRWGTDEAEGRPHGARRLEIVPEEGVDQSLSAEISSRFVAYKQGGEKARGWPGL